MFDLFPAVLTIHDGAAAAGNAGGDGGSQAPGSSDQGETGDSEPVVLYGKQTRETTDGPDAGDKKTQKTEKTPEQKKTEFRNLMQGEYKDEFSAYFQEQFDRRFKDHKSTEEQLKAVKPLMDTLAKRYGVTDKDPKKIVAAFDEDAQILEGLADEAGLSVEDYKRQRNISRQEAEIQEQRQQMDTLAQQAQQRIQWFREGQELKNSIPSFDLSAEMGNKDFANLLASGVSVEAAYKATHFDELANGVAQAAGKRAEQAVVNTIAAKGRRPVEAAASRTPAVVIKDDPSKWSDEDIRAVIEKVKRGEKIRL